MKFKGHIDKIARSYVAGWVWIADQPEEHVEVSAIAANGDVIAKSVAQNFRGDLLKAGIGDGRHAFMILTGEGTPRVAAVKAQFGGKEYDVPRSKTIIVEDENTVPLLANKVRRLNLQLQLDSAEKILDAEPDVVAEIKGIRETIAYNRKQYDYTTIGKVAAAKVAHRLDANRIRTGLYRPAGVWREEQESGSLRISGVVLDEAEKAFIFLDRRLIKIADVAFDDGEYCRGKFDVSIRGAYKHFPKTFSLSVSTPLGPLLHEKSGKPGRTLENKAGSGDLIPLMGKGHVIEIHGNLVKLENRTEWQNAYLRWYDAARDYFEQRLGIKLFLIYGTLLGACREGDFIAHDGDVDVGYLSAGTTPEDVARETAEIMLKIAADGHDVSLVMGGGFFRPTFHGNRADVFPAWQAGGKLWLHNTTSITAEPDIIEPVQEIEFRGIKAYIPNGAERFLERKYGPNWKIPDPSYVTRVKDQYVQQYLRESCVTDPMLEEVQQRLAASGAGKRGKIVRTEA